MAFTGSVIPTSFMLEVLQAVHNFNGAHTFKIALYTSTATLDASTTVYSATNEVTGTGYVAGGATLTLTAAAASGRTIIIDFGDSSWTVSTITARGALIYNSTAGNKAVAVLDFGSNKTSAASTFTVQFPTPDVNNAILRQSSI